MLLSLGVVLAEESKPPGDLLKPVRVETGLLQGVPNREGTVVSFKGIPYAAPPVGILRWREPQPPVTWDGVRRADTFGAVCGADGTRKGKPDLPWSLRNPRDYEEPPFSEDCLYLNVWTPARTAADRLAVLVFLNPGTFSGDGLAKKGILVVTVNWRTGLFGGMGHPELTRESPHRLSGNYGTLDVITALRWVRKNITAFGGDPDKVTLAGYSFASAFVHHLTASPVARGLFRGAICMSFPYDALLTMHKVGDVRQKEQEGLKFAAARKAPTLDALRKMSAADLVAPNPDINGFTGAVLGATFCRDGWSLTSHYPEALDQGLESDVPTLTGITADDSPGAPPVQYLKTIVDSFARDVPNVFGEKKAAFLARQDAYSAFCPVTTDREARELLKRAQLEYRMSTVYCWARRRAGKARTPAFTYIFSQAIPSREHPEFGAFHTSDLVYEFNNLNLVDHPWTEEDRRVADQASSYWANFVKTGNPNGDTLPPWAPFDAAKPSTMALGSVAGPCPIAGKERLGFYLDVLEK
jgi:para-nitrobenzyl esterase